MSDSPQHLTEERPIYPRTGFEEDPAVNAPLGEMSSAFQRHKIGRAKTWNERTPDERVDVLRDHVRGLFADILHVRQMLEQLLCHRHGPQGELLRPLHYFGMGGAMSPGLPGDDKPRSPLD